MLKPIWFLLGNIGRHMYKVVFPNRMVPKLISSYGPYLFDSEFLFSDFKNWSQNHNSAFNELIDAAIGKTCVFDIGAHIGLATMPLSTAVGKNGSVYAFEPAKANLNYLRKHITENGINNVTISETLLGQNITDRVPFFECSQVSGMNSLAIGRTNENKEWVETYQKMTTLDHFCSEYDLIPDLIKLDVEGAESFVLEGGREILSKARPDIYVSVHPRQLVQLGSSADKLKVLIISLGYNIYNLNHCLLDGAELEFGEYIIRSPK